MKTFYSFLVIFAMSVIYSCSKSDMLSNPQESISLEMYEKVSFIGGILHCGEFMPYVRSYWCAIILL